MCDRNDHMVLVETVCPLPYVDRIHLIIFVILGDW